MSLAPLRHAARPGKRSRTLDDILASAQRLLLTRSVASLSISEVAAEAGVVQGTFYNYFENIDALLDEVGHVLLTRMTEHLARAADHCTTPAETFSAKTRQALRAFAQNPALSRMLFDIGLPVDRFLRQLHHDIKADVTDGLKTGDFKAANADLLLSVVCGAITGLALDLHRKRLPATAIDPATAELLQLLGVPAAKAKRMSSVKMTYATPIHLPLTWHSPMNDSALSRGHQP
jgi:AcrR family transcriptional regulator